MPIWIDFPEEFFHLPDVSGHLKSEICVAVTDKLSVPILLAAYQNGAFPWYQENGIFYFFITQPRAVLLPEKLHIGRSLQKSMRRQNYQITMNQCFSEVIAHCATIPRNGQGGTWIAPEFQVAYTDLHRAGHAHSVEFWSDGQLNGGFYGVQIGRVFYGESMFSYAPDASKIALATAVPHFARCGIELIDCQQASAHMLRLGAELMAFSDFRQRLARLNPLFFKR